jgi:hypothetical protein
MQRRKKALARLAASHVTRSQSQTLDPTTLEPNDLFNKTQKALSMLSEGSRETLGDELLLGLKQAGVNIASALMVLGIPARTSDELTPSDIGKLLRYVRINAPKAIESLAVPLTQLLSPSAESARTAQSIREAA